MVLHGHAPGEFAMSNLVPIPKNCKKSLNNSNNYRAIALSSIFRKLLDFYNYYYQMSKYIYHYKYAIWF